MVLLGPPVVVKWQGKTLVKEESPQSPKITAAIKCRHKKRTINPLPPPGKRCHTRALFAFLLLTYSPKGGHLRQDLPPCPYHLRGGNEPFILFSPAQPLSRDGVFDFLKSIFKRLVGEMMSYKGRE